MPYNSETIAAITTVSAQFYQLCYFYLPFFPVQIYSLFPRIFLLLAKKAQARLLKIAPEVRKKIRSKIIKMAQNKGMLSFFVIATKKEGI